MHYLWHEGGTGGSEDAFDILGQSINAMLNRIKALVSQLRIVTDGLAHNLRSPLTWVKSLIKRTASEDVRRKAVAFKGDNLHNASINSQAGRSFSDL